MKAYITLDQAISILPENEEIHTFYNQGSGLFGVDYTREKLIEKLRNSDYLELTGELAKSMNHGLCAYSKDTKWQSEILFIETNPEQLEKLEDEIGGTE